jgi:hypothetical protein
MTDYGPAHNGEASKPLADWRDAEIERLRGLLREAHAFVQHGVHEGWLSARLLAPRIDAVLNATDQQKE